MYCIMCIYRYNTGREIRTLKFNFLFEFEMYFVPGCVRGYYGLLAHGVCMMYYNIAWNDSEGTTEIKRRGY